MMCASNKDFAARNITRNRLEEHTDCESLTREVVGDFATYNIHYLPTLSTLLFLISLTSLQSCDVITELARKWVLGIHLRDVPLHLTKYVSWNI